MPASGWPAETLTPLTRDAGPAGASKAARPALTEAVLQPLADVARRQALLPLAERLLQLRAWLADDLQGLENALQAHGQGQLLGLRGEESRVGQAAGHLLALAGKRIRPLCVILAARMGGRKMDADVRSVATACELVHAATLLHDDVVDDSHERRGAPAARVIYGNSASILAGDHLLVHALRLVGQIERPDLTASLLEVMARMVRAEALQLQRRGRFEPSRELYLEVIRGKTAALFAWGLSAGGTLAGVDAATHAALSKVGLHLGMAFQLVDDVLDMQGERQNTGKDALRDLREGKLTWPLILAAERVPSLAGRLQAVAAGAASGESEPGQQEAVRQVLAEVAQTGAIHDTRAFARDEAQAACDCLRALPPGRAREALSWVVESAVVRLG